MHIYSYTYIYAYTRIYRYTCMQAKLSEATTQIEALGAPPPTSAGECRARLHAFVRDFDQQVSGLMH